MTWAARLWRGEQILVRAFWDYAILYGVPLNLVSTFGFLMLASNDAHPALSLAVNFLPLPYNVLVTVGVWRSTARYAGPAHWADAARVAVAVWFIVELFV